jgi:prevent-host-death family protein
MQPIPGELPISEARANLTEVVNAVRLQDRVIRLTRRQTPQAAIVPVDLADAIQAVGGLARAREIMQAAQKTATGNGAAR